MIRYSLVILSLIFFTSTKGYGCDMMALLAGTGQTIPTFMADTPDTNTLKDDIFHGSAGDYSNSYEFFVFMGKRSYSSRNNDGYGLAYYKNNQILLPERGDQQFYQVGFRSYYKVYPDSVPHEWRHTLHVAYDAIRDSVNDAVIVLGHDRNASSNDTPGSHPFWFEFDEDGDEEVDRTFTFQHAGDCSPRKEAILDTLLSRDADWFEKHPLNWRELYDDPNEIDPDIITDSELLFHLIMWHVIDQNGDVIAAITAALNELVYNGSSFNHVINFILSDGEGLYVFRNSLNSYNLEYKVFDNGFVGVKSQNSSSYTDMEQHTLLHIPRGDSVEVIDFDPEPLSISENYELQTSKKFTLFQNYPNPFNPATTIKYELAKSAHISLKIYDVSGQLIRVLIEEEREAGYHTLLWHGRNEENRIAPAGLYFYRLESDEFSKINKMLLLK